MPYAPEGDPFTSKIVFVGEAPSTQEIIKGRPFVGPAGYVLNECLEKAGILRGDCYITNVFQTQVRKRKDKPGKIFDKDGDLLFTDTKTGGFTPAGMHHVHELEKQLENTNANVYVPLGVPALRAINGLKGILKWRGSILKASIEAIRDKKTIPSIHPANALHGQYINRYIITSDFKRVFREAEFPEVRRPKYNFKLRPTFHQCLEYLEFIKTLDEYVSDIEIGHVCSTADPKGQITRISFAWSNEDAISIPYADGNWTAEQEATLWLETAKVYEMAGPRKWFHNASFDMQILLFIHGVYVAPPYGDTMIAHHIVYPDFQKSLAFCASIHTDQPFWKDMVKHATIENPEG